MAIEKTIVIKADTKQAVTSFDKLGDIINEQKAITIEFEEELLRLERQLERTSKSNLPAQKRLRGEIGNLKNSLKDQRISLKKLNLEQQSSKGATTDLAKAFGGQRNTLTNLSAVTGGYANQLFSVFDLFRSGIKQIKAFVIAQRTAFIATGIGIFLIALAAIAANWDKIIEFIKGANKQLQKQIDQSIELQNSTKLLIDLKDSEIKLAEKEGRLTDELIRQKIDLIKLQSTLNDQELDGLEIQAARLKASALELSTREKIFRAVVNAVNAGTGDALILENQLKDLEKFKELQDLIVQARKEQVDLAILLFDIENPEGEGREDVEGLSAQFQRDRNIEEKSLEAQLEFLNKSLELVQENEDAKFKIQTDNLVRIAAARGKDREDEAIRDRLATQEEKDREQALADFKIAIVKDTLELVGAIAKEGSDLAKGIQVAQATISGIEGVQNAFTTAAASPITTFFPAYPFIQAGFAGAFSAIQIQKIISTNPSSGGGANLGGGGGGGGGASAPSFNLVAGSGTNQIAEGLANQATPIQAFVVSSEVTTAQSLDRNIRNEASFG